MNYNFDINHDPKFNIEPYTKFWNQILITVTEILKINQVLELTLNIIDATEILKLNQKYRQKNYVADVLSFPMVHNNEKLYQLNDIIILGDIFICFEKAQQQAVAYHHSLNRELCFLFLHGLLHLLGYDHQTLEEETIMFALQDQVLTKLKINRSNEVPNGN